MVFLRASLILLLTANGSALDDSSLSDYSFEKYVRDFSKSYESEEEFFRRLKIWEENRNRIFQHNNQENPSYTLEMNLFADLLDEEVPTGYDKSSHIAWTGEIMTASEHQGGHHHHPVSKKGVHLGSNSVFPF
jgi:hypothetical protein